MSLSDCFMVVWLFATLTVGAGTIVVCAGFAVIKGLGKIVDWVNRRA